MKTIIPKQNSYSPNIRDLKNIDAIVIHYTGNRNDTAENNGKYFATTNSRSAGAHYFVDQAGHIVKSVPLKYAAWAVGGDKYKNCGQTGGGKYYGIYTNFNTVSIELCDIVDKDPSPEMIKAVKKLIKQIRKSCPRATKVIRHFDITGKACPASMVDNGKWQLFLALIGESK